MNKAKITPEEQSLLEEWAQKIAPGYRVFDENEFTQAIAKAAEAYKGDPRAQDKVGRLLLPKLTHCVITDTKREGYGVPHVWWWIFFESQIFTKMKQDTWSEVKWWLWWEMHGKGQTLTMHGSQNCIHPDTIVRKYYGGNIRAGDVRVGEILVGSDSTPRVVKTVDSGSAPSYLVKAKESWVFYTGASPDPIFKDVEISFICTNEHKLTVRKRDSLVYTDIQADALFGNSDDVLMKSVENPLGIKFSIEKLPEDQPYVGFNVGSDHRFVLGNGIVTANSGKSAFLGNFAILQLIAWRGNAHFYIAGPYKLHTDDKVWQVLTSNVDFINNHKTPFWMMLGVKLEKQKALITCTDLATNEVGEAKFVAVEDASSIQGKKASEHDDPLKGIMCVIVDEFVENSSLKLKQAEGNIASNNNYFGLLACNPLPEKVQHPNLRPFSAPIEVANLNREHHFRWRTAYGLCVRFAWLNCPNRLLGRSEWKYLLTAERMERARQKGNDTIDAQVDAWGWGGGSKGAPLDEAAIRLAGTYIEPTWQSAATRVMVVDCAFGGQDPATATILEIGEVIIKARDGNPVVKKVAAGVDQIILPVQADLTVTQEWLDEMDQLLAHSGGSFPQTVSSGVADIQVGDKLGGAWDMAFQTLKTMRDYNVVPGNVSFDSSQRGDCTSIMIDCLGRNNVKWFYDGSRKIVDEENLGKGWFKWPYSYQETPDGQREPVKWSAVVSQTISMVWLFACEAIKHGLLCNGTTMKRGLDELCARPVVRSRQGQGEGKKDVIGKEKLKDMGQKSPTYGEGLAMCLYFATRFLGLISLGDPVKSSITITPQLTIQASSLIFSGNTRRLGAGWFK